MSARFERTPPHHERLQRVRRGVLMEYVESTDPRPEPISIARCRELLGKDAESMTDQPSATYEKTGMEMKGWWTRPGSNR
jgi:hypothetical protein